MKSFLVAAFKALKEQLGTPDAVPAILVTAVLAMGALIYKLLDILYVVLSAGS